MTGRDTDPIGLRATRRRPVNLVDGAPIAYPRLYKYLYQKDVHHLITNASVLIGTLYDYREQEERLIRAGESPLRGDRDEGKLTLYEDTEQATDLSDLGPLGRSFFEKHVTNVGVDLANVRFQETVDSPDCWVLCTSTELSRAAAGTYDACIEITHPLAFMRAMTVAITRHFGRSLRVEHDPVLYRSREVEVATTEPFSIPPAPFVKDAERFAVEKEYRFVWDRGGEPPSQTSMKIVVPQIRPFLRPVPIP